MRLRPRSFLSLRLLLLVVLAAVAVWVLRPRPPARVQASGENTGLPSGFGVIARFEFRIGDHSLAVERRGNDYWLTQPLSDRADLSFLLEVRRQAEQLRVGRVLPDSGLAEYGLDPPRSQIVLENAAGARWSLAIGDTTPVGSQQYARRVGRGNPVVLIDQFVARKYFRPAVNALRDRICAPLRDGPLDSLVVWAAGGRVSARPQGEEKWICREPAGLNLDAMKVNPVLMTLRNPTITDYAPPGTVPAQVGLAPPRALWILYQGSRAESVRIGNPTPDQLSIRVLPAQRRGIALLPSEDFRSLVDGWPALADLHLLSTPPESLVAVEFLGEARAGGYRRESGRWVRFPSGHPVNRRRDLETDLRNLCLLQWRKYPRPEPRPEPARLLLRLRLATPAAAETLSLTAPRDSISLARSTRRAHWGEVDAWTWETWSYRAAHPE